MQQKFYLLLKKLRSNIKNYRPQTINPNLLKIYKRCVYDQMFCYLSW